MYVNLTLHCTAPSLSFSDPYSTTPNPSSAKDATLGREDCSVFREFAVYNSHVPQSGIPEWPHGGTKHLFVWEAMV